MKIFLDTANVKQIQEAASLGILDGVTTNPTLIAREKGAFEETLKEICSIVDGPVNAEVVSETADEMVPEAKKLTSLAKNIVIKIPMTKEGIKTVKILSVEGIKTNVTLCFTALQALVAAKAGSTYASLFVGRLDDRTHRGMEIVQDICTIYTNYGFDTQLVVASIRHPLHVLEAAVLGADVATVPYPIFEKIFQHPLTDLGIQTFLDDWKKVQ